MLFSRDTMKARYAMRQSVRPPFTVMRCVEMANPVSKFFSTQLLFLFYYTKHRGKDVTGSPTHH